jgi:hypothetical protein
MLRLVLMAILSLAVAMPAIAKEKADDKSGHDAVAVTRDGHGAFSSPERNLIRSWLLENERRSAVKQPPAGLPPGLQKKAASGKALPPGWQKKLARGEHLDQEYYGWGRALPDDLLRRLPPAPPGSEILQIEDRIIRLDAATRTILDVFGLAGAD